MRLGGLLMTQLVQNSPEQNAALISSVVALGLGYAAGGSSLVALHGHKRACLFLDESVVSVKLAARRRECSRLIRKLQREHPDSVLSFRVSSDFHAAVAVLRKHHAEHNNWVNDAVEQTWKVLFERDEFCILELWQDEVMIAADFCNLIPGGSVYVATRYFNRDKGALAPGFMLALLSAQFLKNAGFVIWDLGQTDFNPLMAYKDVVTTVMPRSQYMQKFNGLQSPVDSIKRGIVIAKVQEEHLIAVEKKKKKLVKH